MSVPFIFSTQAGIIPLNELDANFTFLDTKVPALALAAGVVTQGSQPTITSVGTLGSLSVTGPISAASVSAAQIFGTLATPAQPNINQIGTLTALTVSNTITTGSVVATTLGGQITTTTQPSITGLGTLTDLTVSGAIIGTLATSVQPNITSLGTLSSLTVTGNIVSAGSVSGNGRPLTSISASNIDTGTLASSRLSGTYAINITGSAATVSGAAQPAITSLGTLSSLAVGGLATAPTAANGVSNTQIATTAFVSNSVNITLPSGVIVMWSGSLALIPAGWFLCDGNNGSPDLRDRFIVGAGNVYNPNATGGSANATLPTHTHTATSAVSDPGHAHIHNAPSGFDDGGLSGSVVENIISTLTANAVTGITVATTVDNAGSSGIDANLPPYYALAYIIKA